ncbi:MAG: hypothetical protein ABI821_07735 [Pseudomonadota bacterium]
MNTAEHFKQIGTRGFYRPVGTVTFEQAVEMAGAAMKNARARGLADLLVNACGLSGFASPSVFERYDLAVSWAQSAGRGLRVALVVRPEMMDPKKIAVLMAQNRGVSGDVFLNEADALAWLDGHLTSTNTGAFPPIKPTI